METKSLGSKTCFLPSGFSWWSYWKNTLVSCLLGFQAASVYKREKNPKKLLTGAERKSSEANSDSPGYLKNFPLARPKIKFSLYVQENKEFCWLARHQDLCWRSYEVYSWYSDVFFTIDTGCKCYTCGRKVTLHFGKQRFLTSDSGLTWAVPVMLRKHVWANMPDFLFHSLTSWLMLFSIFQSLPNYPFLSNNCH